MKRAFIQNAPIVGLGLLSVIAFTYPFWLSTFGAEITSGTQSGGMKLVAAAIALVVVVGIGLELEGHTIRPGTMAWLATFGTFGGFARVFDLPAGGNVVFSVVILGAVAFGSKFGFLLGLTSMAVGALLTGGLGPWLPFQMIAIASMGAVCGVTHPLFVRFARRTHPSFAEVLCFASVGAAAALLFGFIINLEAWPFLRVESSMTWNPTAGPGATLANYWRYYLTTSLAWDLAGSALNATLLALLGPKLLRVLVPFSARLAPSVQWVPKPELARPE